MKKYIIERILNLLDVSEEQIKIELPPKDGMGDYSIQCANLRNVKLNNPIEIANYIKDNFDVFTHESDYVYNKYLTKILDKLDKTEKLHKDEFGRKYVDLTGYNIPTRELVLVLTRSNGTSLYPIRDIAYTIHKVKLNNKNNFIVLGEDQEVYMKQISAALDILGYKAPNLICYSYVLLNGDKMSTSGGTVILLTDFMKTVKESLLNEFKGRNTDISDDKLNVLINACIKFTMLNVSKNKIVNFNLKNATSFTGESGMYILYSIARMKSILRNNKITNNSELKYTNEIENKIIKELSLYPEVIDSLLKTYESSHLTKYLFGLTQLFSKFYETI